MRKRGDDAEMEKLSEQLSKQEERLLSKDEEISRHRREVRSLRSQLIESLKTQIYVQNHSWHLTETVKDQYDSLISTQRGDIQPLIDKLCQRLAEQEQEIALLRPLQPKLLEYLDTIVSSAGTWWGEVSGKGRKVVEAVKMLQRCYNTRSSLMSATSVREEGLSASELQPY
jgi:DnaJ-domain-containing protein 1